MKNSKLIYQTKSGSIDIKTDVKNETLWLTQQQVAEIFEVQKAAISKHVKNIFDSLELNKASTVSILETVEKEGNRMITRQQEHYNLDLIISIGYRVNSKKATLFRQWATKTLKSHIVDGYTINHERIKHNYNAFIKAVDLVQKSLPAQNSFDASSAMELIKLFASTWLSLDAYDKSEVLTTTGTRKKVELTAQELQSVLAELKQELMDKKEASEIFGVERQSNSIEGIVGNVFQTFDGKDVYPTIEEKAVNLLYFIIKNHPFIDGNKRSGAFAFIWFLNKNGLLNSQKITPVALTSLTILVAESHMNNREQIIGLILLLLRN
jgi:death-on-curing family protein